MRRSLKSRKACVVAYSQNRFGGCKHTGGDQHGLFRFIQAELAALCRSTQLPGQQGEAVVRHRRFGSCSAAGGCYVADQVLDMP